MTTELHSETLEWAAEWIEGSLKGEANERVREFAHNMATTLRAAKTARVSAPIVAPVVDDTLLSVVAKAAKEPCRNYARGCPENQPDRSYWCAPCDARVTLSKAAPASTVAPVEQSDDGWVTFGRVKVDIENETETFERIDPSKEDLPR